MFSFFLFSKLFVAQIFAEPLQLTVEMECLDIALQKGAESFNQFSFLGSDAFTRKFFFPSMILLRVSNTTLSDQFFGY